MATKTQAAPALSLFFGNDRYWVDRLAKERLAQLVPEANQAFGLDPVDGAVESGGAAAQAVRRCLESLDTPAFLGGDKVVWLKNASFLGASGRSTRGEELKQWLDRLTGLLKKGLMPGVHFLITAVEVDKRSSFYKACDKAGETRECAITEKSYQVDKESGAIIQAALKEAGLTADEEAVLALVEREGCDTQQIRNEVEKLRLYLGDAKRVTREDVEAVVCSVRGSQPWDLADALAERNLGKSLKVLDRLLDQKVYPTAILVILENRFREFLVYREGLERGWLKPSSGYGSGSPWGNMPEDAAALAARILGKDPRSLPGFVAGIRVRQAQAFSKVEILRGQRLLLETHRQLLTTGTDPQRLLELMLIKLLRRASKPPIRPAR